MSPGSRFHPAGRLAVREILEATGGRLVAGPGEGSFSFCTDSREMADDSIFVALVGETHDGHDYLTPVLGSHRCGGLVSRVPEGLPEARGPIVQVDDTLAALGSVARAFLRRQAPPVLAITGSVGKTTTRAMLGSILRQGSRGLETQGNFNNRIGLPLTLLGLEEGDRWAVLEMGMSEPGEIRALCDIASPNVRVLTTVTESHLEFFDSVEGIADAKAEIFEGAVPGDVLVRPESGWFVERMPRPTGTELLTFSADHGSEASVRVLDYEDRGLQGCRAELSICGRPCRIELALPGRHQLLNALAAAAAAAALGVENEGIAAGLSVVEVPGRRMRVERVGGVTVLDDAYNANPASVAAALATLAAIPCDGRRIAALGDMLELGETAPQLHAEVGRLAARQGVDLLLGAGPMMAHAVAAARDEGLSALGAPDARSLAESLAGEVSPGDILLLKGSRGMRMEELLEELADPRKGA